MVSGMNLRRLALAGAVSVATVLGTSVPSALSQSAIEVDGSSTVFPITEAMAEEFGNETGIDVNVGVSGTGGGFRRFCAGETDISNASRPIKDSEAETCAEAGIEYVEIPVAYDALTVVINPDNDWAGSMTVEQLAALWSSDSEIEQWSDINPAWPDEDINLYGPGTDSGTFDYFVEEIIQETLGDDVESRADYTASEDDNILVTGVSRDEFALGYFGFAYYLENQSRLSSVAVNDVAPTVENVENGSYTPLSRPIFIYVSKNSLRENPALRRFVAYYIANAETIVPEVGYVPLPEDMYARGRQDVEAVPSRRR